MGDRKSEKLRLIMGKEKITISQILPDTWFSLLYYGGQLWLLCNLTISLGKTF